MTRTLQQVLESLGMFVAVLTFAGCTADGNGPMEEVSDVVEAVAEEAEETNPAVRKAHERVPKQGLKYQVTSLVCQATGGPCAYIGRDMKTAHAHLNITEEEWEALMQIFHESFDHFEVPEREQAELFEIIDGTKADIVMMS